MGKQRDPEHAPGHPEHRKRAPEARQRAVRPARRSAAIAPWDPFAGLRHDLDRMVEAFWGRGFGPGSLTDEAGVFVPSIDVCETDNELRVTAELPGIREEDIELTVEDDLLRLRGEKHEEESTDQEGLHRMERRYGSFLRTIPLGVEVDPQAARASFKNGVLTVTLPKREEHNKRRHRIEVKPG